MTKSYIGKIILGLGLCISAAANVTASDSNDTPLVKQCLKPNHPVGTPRGIFPGRVAWSHAPGAANWNMTDGFWFDDSCNSQDDCDWLMDQTIRTLTGSDDAAEAWNKIFSHFNFAHGNGYTGYKPGEKITVKINNNNTYSHADSKEINASPQMVYALLRSLTEQGGVRQSDIFIAEPSRFITEYLFNKCHKDFPEVHFVDHSGQDGREQVSYTPNAMHYSKDNGQLATGIATVFTDADYVIDMALLKGHVGQGVTLCGKNWYGAMSIHSDWRKNFHDNFNQNADGSYKYMTFVDFMGHDDLGGKCMLWLIDGLYGSRNVDGEPAPKWKMAPFDNAWPCSLFGSLDPVAIDMVGMDFLISEFPDMPDVNYSDMYLVEASMANDAPSRTVYCPDGDDRPLKSLGVAEHWNNPVDKRYSGGVDDRSYGIDLIYVSRK